MGISYSNITLRGGTPKWKYSSNKYACIYESGNNEISIRQIYNVCYMHTFLFKIF